MSLLRNLLGTIHDQQAAAFAQINPLDHGADYNSTRQVQQQQQAAAVRPLAGRPAYKFLDGSINQTMQNLPTQNIDGTFNNQPVGSAISSGESGIPTYRPNINSSYLSGVEPAIPYEPNSIPKKMNRLPLL